MEKRLELSTFLNTFFSKMLWNLNMQKETSALNIFSKTSSYQNSGIEGLGTPESTGGANDDISIDN